MNRLASRSIARLCSLPGGPYHRRRDLHIGTAGCGVVFPTQQASFVPLTPPRRAAAAVYDRFSLAGQTFATNECWPNRWSFSRRTMSLVGRPKRTEEEIEERRELLEERKEQLRVLLSAPKEEIDNLVRLSPGVLERRNIEENHGPKVALLQERLGISKKAAGRVCLKRNKLLTVSSSTLEKKMDWLQAKLGLSKPQLRKIVERSPVVLLLSIDDNLEPTIDNIQTSLELSDEELTKIIVRQPDLLIHNMSDGNIKQRMTLLPEILGLPVNDVAGLRKRVIRKPDILFWPEERMKEIQQWIKQRFGLKDGTIAQMCRNMPQLLCLNTTTLDDKAGSIQSALTLSDEELSDLVAKCPSIFSLSTEKNLRPKLQYLRTRLELDDDALKNLLLKQQPLFGLSEGNIEEKFQFYINLVGEREAERLVVKSSNLLTRSLKKLQSRLEEVEESGVKVRWTETLIKRLAERSNALWERHKLGEAPRGGGLRTGNK